MNNVVVQSAAKFLVGVTCGSLLTYNANQIYYFSFRRHIYVPVQHEIQRTPVDWNAVMGTLRKGLGDCLEEIK